MLIISALCGICILLNRSSAELYSAIADLEVLLKTHDKVIYDLERYIDTGEKRLNVMKSHLSLYKTEHNNAIEDISNYVENPINSYTLIKRLTTDLEFIENISKVPIEFDRDEALVYPTKEDLDGAITALARLQDTYRMNVTLLARGALNGTFSHGSQPYTEKFTSMSASDCYELGSSLYKAKNYKIAIDWLVEAFWKYDDNTPEAYSFTVVDILEQIADTYRELDDIRYALKWTKLLLTLKPDHTTSLVEEYEKRIADEENVRLNKTEEDQTKVLSKREVSRNIYKALCRGEMDSPSVQGKRLKCRYLTETHPFLKIAPIKLEELFSEPDVFLFYDVLYDEEILYMKEIATPRFERAKVVSEKGEFLVVHYRTNKSAWLKDDDEVLSRVSRRVVDLTGMSLDSSEYLQVANYGIGGHYAAHYDFMDNAVKNISKYRDRIGTVLFYMTNVAQGGATVFTKLGLTVFPLKGAAIFWRNLHPSGENDYNTHHAACPVLRGSKWVSTQWISESGQEFLQPCNLEYQDVNYNQNIPPPTPKFL